MRTLRTSTETMCGKFAKGGRILITIENLTRVTPLLLAIERVKKAQTNFRAESLLNQLAALRELCKQAKKRFVLRVRQHPDYRILSGLPGFGPVHVGQLIATVGTPHRFRTKRQF